MNISAIVLAAGKGTRMKSLLPKVLHPVFFKPMVYHVLDRLTELNMSQILVVTGHENDLVEDRLVDYSVDFVFQKEQNGTGHAVQLTESMIPGDTDNIMILCGDSPLISSHTLQLLLSEHLASGSDITVLSTVVADPTNYGRMVCDDSNQLLAIVEEKDTNTGQKDIKEINGGIYITRRGVLFDALSRINTSNAQGELYLTDIVKIAKEEGRQVARVICSQPDEVMGVNSRKELMLAHDVMQNNFFEYLLDQGISLIRPSTLSIHPTAIIGADTTINSNVSIGINVIVGSFCILNDHCYIENSYIGDNVIIGSGCKLIGVNIPSNTVVDPGSVQIFENEIKVS